MKRFGLAALGISAMLVIGLVATVVLFLRAVLFAGAWPPVLWAAALSAGFVVGIKLLALGVLNAKDQLLVSGMLAELLSGAFGWTWIVLAVASAVLILKAFFFGGAWSNVLVCLLLSGTAKRLLRYAMTTAQAAGFKRDLVEQGMSKHEARQMWIAHARALIHQREP